FALTPAALPARVANVAATAAAATAAAKPARSARPRQVPKDLTLMLLLDRGRWMLRRNLTPSPPPCSTRCSELDGRSGPGRNGPRQRLRGDRDVVEPEARRVEYRDFVAGTAACAAREHLADRRRTLDAGGVEPLRLAEPAALVSVIGDDQSRLEQRLVELALPGCVRAHRGDVRARTHVGRTQDRLGRRRRRHDDVN